MLTDPDRASALLAAPTQERLLRLCRFVTVGGGTAAIFFALGWALVTLGLHPAAGALLAYVLAFCIGYSAQQRWTFLGQHSHGHALPRYMAVQIGCALLSGGVASFSADVLGLQPMAMSLFTTLVAGIASYVASVYWVFPLQAARQRPQTHRGSVSTRRLTAEGESYS